MRLKHSINVEAEEQGRDRERKKETEKVIRYLLHIFYLHQENK